MTGDRERCLEAGMDGYISKPIRNDKLFQSIQAVVGKKLGLCSEPSPQQRPRDISDMDEQCLNPHSYAKSDLEQEIVQAFQEEVPVLIKRVERALTEGDSGGLSDAAHALKGAAAQVGPAGIVEVAEALEIVARRGDLSEGKHTFEHLEQETNRLTTVLSVVKG
jgi:two-component system, sensor histidine kinase and response regulator